MYMVTIINNNSYHVQMKYCPKCQTEKPTSEFYKRKQSKDGLRSYCKLCENLANRKRESEYSDTRKKYRETENYKEIKRKYYKNNKQKVLDSNKAWAQSQKGKYFSYKRSAEQRDILWELTESEFLNFWDKSCFYCGDSIKTIGIDRIDSTLSYTLDNCVPCCSVCNKMKLNLTQDKFILQIRKIFKNMEKNVESN